MGQGNRSRLPYSCVPYLPLSSLCSWPIGPSRSAVQFRVAPPALAQRFSSCPLLSLPTVQMFSLWLGYHRSFHSCPLCISRSMLNQ
jgi:hypothetical protein